MRICLAAGAALCLGLVAGFFIGRAFPAAGQDGVPGSLNGGSSRPASIAELLEQTAILKSIRGTGTFEVFYPHQYASPPSLEVLDDHPRNGWLFRLAEQRADGFKLEVSAGSGLLNEKPLRYVAKGTPFEGTVLSQEGEALVPTASKSKLGEFDVFYRTPFPSPPRLTFPAGMEGCIVVDQKATGFKLEREATSGITYAKVKWRAELAMRK